MTRTHSWPEGHWNWPIPVTHKHGVRQGDLCFVGGQVDLDPEGNVLHADDIAAQTPVVVASLGRVLDDLGSGLSDLVKIVIYHVDDGSLDESTLIANIAAALPDEKPAFCTVPVPYLAYPGMRIEIEGVAAIGEKTRVGEKTFPDGVRCGDLVWTSSISGGTKGDIVLQSEEVMERLSAILAALGADFDDVVKFNIFYVGSGTAADWEVAARVRARYFNEPGPAATGVPLPRLQDPESLIKMDVWAMRAADGRRIERTYSWPEGHWDWPIHLPYKHGNLGGGMFFVGGQVSLTPDGDSIDPFDMQAQTRTSMDNIKKVLDGLGASMDDIVKVTTFYKGDGGGTDLHENLSIRSAYFSDPGPATTGVSLPFLAYSEEGMMIEIEVIGMLPTG